MRALPDDDQTPERSVGNCSECSASEWRSHVASARSWYPRSPSASYWYIAPAHQQSVYDACAELFVKTTPASV